MPSKPIYSVIVGPDLPELVKSPAGTAALYRPERLTEFIEYVSDIPISDRLYAGLLQDLHESTSTYILLRVVHVA